MSRRDRTSPAHSLKFNSVESTSMENMATNGWQREGQVMGWVLSRLQGNDLSIYLAIVKRTVGFSQYTSDITSYECIAGLTNVSLPTIKRVMPKLIETGYIIKLSTNTVANVGKLAYRYQLNMKLPGFPSLGKLRNSSADELPSKSKKTKQTPEPKPLPPVTDYVLQGAKLSLISQLEPTKMALLTSRGLMHPTIDQLTNYLGIEQ